jgi:hypothetical protein
VGGHAWLAFGNSGVTEMLFNWGHHVRVRARVRIRVRVRARARARARVRVRVRVGGWG